MFTTIFEANEANGANGANGANEANEANEASGDRLPMLRAESRVCQNLMV